MRQIQQKIKSFSTLHGFDSETTEQKFILLIEEVGEFAKATRKSIGMKIGNHSKDHQLEEEAADVLYVLADISNKLNIDLDQALDKKLKKFANRKYSSEP